MKSPTKDLSEEHGGVLLMSLIMDKVADKLKQGEEVEKDHLDKILEFLRNFVDKCHHGKEEGILFPELTKTAINLKTINELLAEHKTGRDYIRGIAESLDKYKPGSPDAIHIAINMKDYIQLISGHIKKENELFKTAGNILSEKLQREVEEKFEDLEKNVIGEGKHEEYHGWIKELRSIYLS